MTPAETTPGTVSRANAYHALAWAFGQPADWDATLQQELPALQALDAEAAAALQASLGDRESAAVAHAKLFLGPYEIHAPPYASLYLDPERRLMGPVSEEAAQAYAEAGLGPGQGPKDAPDHVVHEFEFMYFLAYQEATTADPIWEKRQRRFWQTHLGRWLPELVEAMTRAHIHPFYDALAELLRGFVETESALFTP